MSEKIATEPSERRVRPPLFHMSGTSRVWILNLGLAAAAALVFQLWVRPIEPLGAPIRISWWGMAMVCYLGEILVVHLQFKRDAYSFTLAEISLVIGLYFARPSDMIIGVVVGAFFAVVVHRRQSPLKSIFNIAHFTLEACLAILVFFSLISHSTMNGPAGWAITLLATFTSMFVSIWMVAFAISLSEGRMRIDTVPQSVLYGSTVMLTNTSLALIATEILWTNPPSALLLGVPVGLLFVSYRAYIGQREKRESIELLYESSRSVQRQQSAEQAIITLLNQAREMFRAETAQITLFADDEKNMAYRTSVGPGERLDVMQSVELNPKEGVWARVTAEGQAILIPRPIDNDRLRVHFASRGIYKDAMVAPLFGGGGVLGTMLVGDRLGEVSTFDEEDLKLFETLANHASVSIENARLVDRLKESLAHLTEMNRLKDDFVAAVSHELRTPLTSIQGYVKTLLRPEMANFDHSEQVSFLQAVDRQSDRLRSLIEDLLVVARLDSHEVMPMLAPVHVEQVVERVLDELRDRRMSHDLETDLPDDLPTIESDEGKIHQIVTNLVDNACKYTPDGTKVRVKAALETEGIAISVVDQGPGIPPEEHEKIFDRFYQVDQSSTRKVGGTGLGLYLCRRLADALGGRIWLERSDASGSTFCLWVPLNPPVAPKLPLEAPGRTSF